jgi:hypothetical protein
MLPFSPDHSKVSGNQRIPTVRVIQIREAAPEDVPAIARVHAVSTRPATWTVSPSARKLQLWA